MKKLKFGRSKAQPSAVGPKKTKLTKLPSVWQLFGRAFGDYAKDWKAYTLILIFVAIPSNLLSYITLIYNLGSASDVVTAYMTLGSLIMTVALLYSVAKRFETGQVPGPRAAYYDGSAVIVRFILVSSVLVLCLIPALLGVVIEGVALEVASYSSTFGPEQLIAGAIALVCCIPSVILLTRRGLALMIAVSDGLGPVASLRAAKLLTIGRFWAVLGRLSGLLLFGFIVSFLAYIMTFVNFANIPLVLFQFLATVVALPIVYIYIYHLYTDLKNAMQPEVGDKEVAS